MRHAIAGRIINVRISTTISRFMPDSKPVPQIIQPDIIKPQALMPGEIHLYVISVAELQQDETLLTSYINDDEDARARRFINPQHGRQYRNVRGMLRRLLSRYLDTAPEVIEFSYAEHGKPSLKNNSKFHFNLSHSRDMAAYAFSRDLEMGVDIEFMRPQKRLQGMIQHIGSAKEQTELKSLPEAEVLDAFYRLWTRKEAFIKAVGRGLGMGLRSIQIGIDESDSPLAVEYKNEILPEWFVQDIKPPQDYKLALCALRCAQSSTASSC